MGTKYKYNEARKEWSTLVYDGTYTSTGEKHRKRITSKKSSKDLERLVREFKESLEEEAVTSYTLGEYAFKWFELYKSNKEINTRNMYLNAIHYLEPIEDIQLTALTRSHFQTIININQEHSRTCTIIYQTVKQILKSAVLDGCLSDNSLRKITADISLPKSQKREKEPLTELETKALLNCDLDAQKRAFVTILYYCGLRKGEALALDPEDFDFKNRQLTINKVIVFDKNTPVLKPYPKSNNGVRKVPLSRPCISILKPYVVNCKGALFKCENSLYMTAQSYKSMWASIVMSCNKYLGYNPCAKKNKTEKPITNLTAHRLRHNFCSLLCYEVPTISTKTIAKILGDNEDMVLKVYSHILEEKEDAEKAINHAFKG